MFFGLQLQAKLFIGDPAQLPPVGTNLSPALDASYLNATYSMEIHEHSLTQVVRQKWSLEFWQCHFCSQAN